jgi:hypothetical protein
MPGQHRPQQLDVNDVGHMVDLLKQTVGGPQGLEFDDGAHAEEGIQFDHDEF